MKGFFIWSHLVTRIGKNELPEAPPSQVSKLDLRRLHECKFKIKPANEPIQEIVGATRVAGEVTFLVRWQKNKLCDLVKAEDVKTAAPEVVLRYYDKYLNWRKTKWPIEK